MDADSDVTQLLHALSFRYGIHGETRRSLVLLLLAARLAPDNVALLRSLAHAFLIDGSPEGALAIIDRLESMEGAEEPALQLMKSKALWAADRKAEARDSFREFLKSGKAP